MTNLQIKGLPAETHDALRRRARAEHTTMSRLVADMIERDLSRVRMDEWIARNRAEAPHVDVDVVELLDQVREEYDPR